MQIIVSAQPTDACAEFIASRLAAAVADRGVASLAVSGGSTAPPLFGALNVTLDREEWEKTAVWQVDERVAPDGDDDRNANQLSSLPVTAAHLHTMRVGAGELPAAVADYASGLPTAFDVVHLGIGSDGHTASWPPQPHADAQRALESDDPVFTVGEFNGRERMTLGRSVVNSARARVVLATGSSKAAVVARWVTGSRTHSESWLDPQLPIAGIEQDETYVFLDPEAAAELDARDYVANR